MRKLLQPVKNRLIIALAASILCVAALATALTMHFATLQEDEVTQTLHLDLAQHVIKDYLLIEDDKVDIQAAKKLFRELMILGPNFEFYFLDLSGKILAYSNDPSLVTLKNIDTTPIKNILAKQQVQLPIYGENPLKPSTHNIFSVAQIQLNDTSYGYLYIILGSHLQENISNRLASRSIQLQLLVLLGLALLSITILIFILSRFVTKPLARLTKDIKQENFQHFKPAADQEELNHLNQWHEESNNEFHQLGSSFKHAHQALSKQYYLLAENERVRKELLAHLSHDLRTPMASLLGYLETYLIQQHNLSPADQHNYIEIAKKNAEKVYVLLEQLFELAHLDSNQVSINYEQFPIAELVQDVLSNFKMKAHEKHIILEFLPKDSGILVSADIEKLDRVLNNLIENALRHTQPNGLITIKFKPEHERVLISIKDTGSGISAEDLPYIFDAHFKAKNSIRENTAHGGLGLAITKRLIELHNSTIQVQSRLGQGTEFKFNLPINMPK